MDREALKWFRENSSYTENSGSVSQTPIQYVGGRNAGFNFPDRAQVTPNKYFGTPAEFNANFQPGKFVSVESPPNEGKVFFAAYPPNPNITTRTVFPGNANNDNGKTSGSPLHLVKLYFAGRTSLSLNTNNRSTNYKIWS